jgi:pentapeptide MXKDX repeat protein
MNTRTMRGLLIATAMLALTVGACKKKPKEDKSKADDTMDVMKADAMDVMKADAMKADAMKADAMKADAMKADAMKAGMDAKQPVAKGDGFILKFDRPLTVGLKYKVVASGKVVSKSTVNGKILAAQSLNTSYAFTGVVTVKGVHAASGKATNLEIKISKFSGTNLGVTKALLPADTLVLGESSGTEETFSVKGKPVEKHVKKVLGYVISLYTGEVATSDEIFGPGGPKKPGDSWKPNAAKMLAGLKRKFKNPALWPKLSDVLGKVTFVAAKKVDGLDVLEIAAKFKLNNLAPKMGPVKVTAGYLELAISGWMPKDPKIVGNDDRSRSMKMHFEGEVKKGTQNIKIVVDFSQSGKRRTTPVK